MGFEKAETNNTIMSSTETFLFLHGNSTSSKIFEKLIKHFPDNIITYCTDNIGHGNDSLEFEPTMANQINALKKYIFEKSINFSNLHVIGHSLGGHIAIQLCANMETTPKSLHLIGTPPTSLKKIEGVEQWTPSDKVAAVFHLSPCRRHRKHPYSRSLCRLGALWRWN